VAAFTLIPLPHDPEDGFETGTAGLGACAATLAYANSTRSDPWLQDTISLYPL
jgi:hypothetical protein